MTVAAMLAAKGGSVITASPGELVSKIVERLAENKIGAIVVTDDKDAVCGIVSERDIVRDIARSGSSILGQPVSKCMTANVISCAEEDTIDQVMAHMTKGRFRHLPVQKDGRLIGIISIGDVVKRKIEQAERDAEDLRNYIAAG